ncbi:MULTISPECIES: LCP family protein [unclassified Meiothermus]|uniref:LCP family protein n=1 Tax=unclassified Meiothermus TaxID=370471 RepID=UPI000D7C39EA|nr:MULTISPECIES: LCP family protein [unclassified Meiothermus]PZA06992.1 LytR family transcriptional regulator [Meiothermus sp. Pnk-1]RYM35306.1 LytR family transcriptional regulator [Meiothermus sp. PNK-Is4]
MRRLIWVLLLIGLAALGYWAFPLLQAFFRYGSLPRSLNNPLNVLVQGVSPEYSGYHTRAPENFRGHADTLLLVRFDPGQKRVVVLSIPRDTYVQLPGHGYRKINEANVLGGPELAKQAVSSLVGVPVDAYVSISTEALRQAVDALGGVVVCVERPLHYRDSAAQLEINLEPGCQRLDGKNAEAYLRFRKDALGDIGRIQRQQAFFQALHEQLLSPAGALRLPQVVAAVEANLRTDLGRAQIGQLLGFAMQRPSLVSLLLPGGFGGGWEVDQAGLEALVKRYFKGQGAEQAAAVQDLQGRVASVIYAPEQWEEAKQMRDTLHRLGMRVILREVDAAPQHSEVLSNGDSGLARALASQLGISWRISGETTLGADLTVRLGASRTNP